MNSHKAEVLVVKQDKQFDQEAKTTFLQGQGPYGTNRDSEMAANCHGTLTSPLCYPRREYALGTESAACEYFFEKGCF